MLVLRFEDLGTARTYELTKNAGVVGRLPACDVVLSDMSVSRRHAMLRIEEGRCYVQDVGSRLGTAVNGRRLLATEDPTAAGPGDVLKFGDVIVHIEQRVDANDLLSEGHALIDGPGSVYKSIDAASATTQLAAGHLVRLIAELGRTLVSSRPLPDILRKVVDLAFGAVPAERAFLLLRESEDAAVEARLLLHRDGTVPTNPTLSRAVVRRVLRERVAILAADATLDPALSARDSIQQFSIRSFICAPLWSGDTVIGVLYLDSPRRSQFSVDHLETISALANAAAVAIEQSKLASQLLEERQRSERLQRYHSPAVVSRIMNQGADTGPTTRERDVTVMFCDLVGFTALCEPLAPMAAAGLLNSFLTHMTGVVFEHEGTLDKYLGDALLAVFGAPFDQPDHPLKAIEAALRMREGLVHLNAGRADAEKLEMRIAINTGVALTGDIGSPRRREFTVVGDVVNVAARIQSEIAAPGEIVITGSTYERVKGSVQARRLPSKVLRGRANASEFYAVEGL